MNVDESLMQQCVGECLSSFAWDAKWEKGHEKVTVNGEPVLLRRCSLTCNFRRLHHNSGVRTAGVAASRQTEQHGRQDMRNKNQEVA